MADAICDEQEERMADMSDDAVILGCVNFSDADVVVRLFLRTEGRISVFARSARASKKRFVGGLQPFSVGTVSIKSRRGDALPLLAESRMEAVLLRQSVDEVALGRAAYLAELVEKLIPEALPSPDTFQNLCDALSLLTVGGAALLRAFELRLLDEQGSLPELSHPRDDPSSAVVAYDANAGHLLSTMSPSSVPFDDAARRAAVRLLSSPLARLPDVDDDTLRVVGRIFAGHLRRQNVGPLKSVAFLKSLTSLAARPPTRDRT